MILLAYRTVQDTEKETICFITLLATAQNVPNLICLKILKNVQYVNNFAVIYCKHLLVITLTGFENDYRYWR